MTETSVPDMATLAAALRGDSMRVGDIVAAAQSRVTRFNGTFRAFSHLAAVDPAHIAALDAEIAGGRGHGPLHGMTASVKGSIPVADLPYTEGSAIFAARRAGTDAEIVARLRRAGAVVLGTTTLSELAMYGVTNPFEPMGVNPWNPERTAGGSSTGAGVAAALGMAQVNIGTDSGGSLRNPACHCGVVGFMPRMGGLPLEGAANHTPGLSSIGLVGRTVGDVAAAFAELAGRPASPATNGTARLLVPRRLVERMCEEETLALFEAALETLRAIGIDMVDAHIDGWEQAQAAAGIVSLHESGQALAMMDTTRASEGIRRRAAAAAALSPAAVADARRARLAFREALGRTLAQHAAEAVATPTWPFPAPPLDADTTPVQGRDVPVDPHRSCFVRAANAADAPALSLPMGLYASCGVPAGLHLMTADGEGALLALAGRIEAALPRLPLPPPLRTAAG